MMMKTKILVVEDETHLAKGLILNFELEGYEVTWANSNEKARDACLKTSFDLILLDLMLPDGSGFGLLQEIKHKDVRQPVLILTACASDEDRITGLSYGADDYVTKPFRLEELILRVRGMVRRSNWYRPVQPDEIMIGQATLRPPRSVVEREGQTHLLTERELTLVLHLWRKRNEFVSREELLVEVWGYSPETITRTVDIFISRLRRILGDNASAPTLLITRRGQGYMLVGN